MSTPRRTRRTSRPVPVARWWTVRPARSRRAATYRCPLCGKHLLAATEHLLIVPEGDASRRRHAHTECVLRERRAGRFALREDVPREARGRGPIRALLGRLLGRVRAPSEPPPL